MGVNLKLNAYLHMVSDTITFSVVMSIMVMIVIVSMVIMIMVMMSVMCRRGFLGIKIFICFAGVFKTGIAVTLT